MQTYSTASDGPRYARARTLAARLDVHVSTLWRWVELGRLPAPRKLGPGVTAWDLDEVDRYLHRGE